jgi:hypothetical protein
VQRPGTIDIIADAEAEAATAVVSDLSAVDAAAGQPSAFGSLPCKPVAP